MTKMTDQGARLGSGVGSATPEAVFEGGAEHCCLCCEIGTEKVFGVVPLPFIVCASWGAAMGSLFEESIVQINVSTALKTPPLLHGTWEEVTKGNRLLSLSFFSA